MDKLAHDPQRYALPIYDYSDKGARAHFPIPHGVAQLTLVQAPRRAIPASKFL